MKKNLLFSTVFGLASLLYVLPADASYCACAGRCSTGASCNCSTGACTLPSRYAYGYVDTAAPMVYAQPTYPVYRSATPYVTSEPARKYAPLRAAPYMAVRASIHSLKGDVKYSSTVQNNPSEGGNWQKDFDDDVFSGSLAFGMKKLNWRGELEASIFQPAEKSITFSSPSSYGFNPFKSEVQINTLLFNVFYDFPTDSPFTPFVGAGVGVAHIKGKFSSNDYDSITHKSYSHTESHKKTNFAWQIGAGISYAVSGTVNLDLAYRYTHFGKAKLQSYSGCDIDADGGWGDYVSDHTVVDDLTSHSLTAGIRFSF